MSQPQPAANGPPQARIARIEDVPVLHALLEAYSSRGNLLPRPVSELYRHLRDFFVVDVDGRPVACGALEIFTAELGEVRSLAVDEAHAGRGLGSLLVRRIIDEARLLGLSRLMALTYVPAFFHRLGFETVPKETLPEKVWGVCVTCYKFHHCDEIAVLRRLS